MAKRDQIYYWKCDRPFAFFAIGTPMAEPDLISLESDLKDLLTTFFNGQTFVLRKASGQGNHLTYCAEQNGMTYFVRIENGPDEDDYMEVEAEIMRRIGELGLPVPKIYAVDATRSRYPFAYQIMEKLSYSDLNALYRAGSLHLSAVLMQLGRDMAHWQSIPLNGFGPFDIDHLRANRELVGLHADYPSYYGLNLEKHLNFLVERAFLSLDYAQDLLRLIRNNVSYLSLTSPCLVHKDMALWNLMGDSEHIRAYIDWDDAVAGDPCDDIALMGCFLSGTALKPLLVGYRSVQPLPDHFEIRFWLHLLRNMIFKAVIRVGAGYFNKDSSFFLLGSIDANASLEQITRDKIEAARLGLLEGRNLETLM